MLCGVCHTDNASTANFCTECGARLRYFCPACNFENVGTAKFCSECGASLATPAPSSTAPPSPPAAAAIPTPALAQPSQTESAERRIVTVLFADMVGSTAMAEKLDPEEHHGIMNDLFQRLSECITRHDGTIDKYMGDNVMALFGAPTAHENDPERAVRAALEMQAALREFDADYQRLGASLAIRIGINSGEVIAGHVGSDAKTDYTVMGDAVNTASRLEHDAPAGGILVGESIYTATRWAFEYQQLEPLQLKGKAEKVIAYKWLGKREQPLAARGFEGVRIPLLGRERELRKLLDALELCRQGEPQIVALVGDAGIGKSRLVREFLSRAFDLGLISKEQCSEAIATADQPHPFEVARQIFNSAVADDSTPYAVRLRKLLGYDLGSSDDEQVRYLSPEQRKQHLYLLARELLTQLASNQPLLVVVEDLHWADESSLDLLRFLAARPGQLQLMLLLTHRTEFTGTTVWSTKARLSSVALSPLPEEVTSQLLRIYFGESFTDFPPAFVAELLRRAEGNPFYLEELVRSLIQSGTIKREERWRVPSSAEQLAVPAPIRGLLLARIDRLDGETRRLLQEAAVLGQSFPAKLLSSFVTINAQLSQRMRELVEGEWLVMKIDPASGEPLYRFQHGLVRDVAYENLLVRSRTALHRRAAKVIERQYSDHLDKWVQALGEHYYMARDEEKGIRYMTLAGEQAASMYANSEAATCFRRALELLSPDAGLQRACLNTKLGDVLQARGDIDEGLECWKTAIEWYEYNGETDQTIALHRRAAHALWLKGNIDEAQEHLRAGLSRLEETELTAEAAALFQELASLWLHRGDSCAATEWAQRALELSQRLEAHQQASLAATTLGVALARCGDVEGGQRSMEEALRTAMEHNLPLAWVKAACNLAVLYSISDPLHAAEICEKGLAEARRIGYVAIQPWFCATLAGSLHACASDYETATRSAEMAVELDKQLGMLSHLPVPLIVLAQIAHCHNRLAEAEAGYGEALRIAEDLADPQLVFPCLEGLGTICVQRGDIESGRAYLKRARNICEAAGFSMDEMVLMPFLH